MLSVLLTKVKSKRGEKYESFTQLLYGTLKELGEKASEAKIHKQMLANWHLLESTGNIARILWLFEHTLELHILIESVLSYI